jgi:excisionase family DNA binding protein
MSNDEELLDAQQVAKLLHIHWRTVQRMAKRGELRGYYIVGQYRFSKADVEEYLEKQRLHPPKDEHTST